MVGRWWGRALVACVRTCAGYGGNRRGQVPSVRVSSPVGYANGTVGVYHVTAERLVAESRIPGGAEIQAVRAISPKDDGVAVWDGRRVWKLDFDARYPEVSWSTLFGAVWYEGYQRPEHTGSCRCGSGTRAEAGPAAAGVRDTQGHAVFDVVPGVDARTCVQPRTLRANRMSPPSPHHLTAARQNPRQNP